MSKINLLGVQAEYLLNVPDADLLQRMKVVVEQNDKSWLVSKGPSQKYQRRIRRQAMSSNGRNKLSRVSKSRRLANKRAL